MTRQRNINMLTRMAALCVSGNEVAERAKIGRTTLSLILNQRTAPKPETQQKIATALDCKPSDLWPEVHHG